MQTLTTHQVPVYTLEPNEHTGDTNFKMYHFNGERPHRDDLLKPHRKDHYLFVLMRSGGHQQWIDMAPYVPKENSFYFVGPDNIIVKEVGKCMWSTGIAFTRDFMALQEGAALANLPIVKNPHNIHELSLSPDDTVFIEDILVKLDTEYRKPGEWQQRMLAAHTTALLTYMSRLYAEQATAADATSDKSLLKKFQSAVNENYLELHEVTDYAAQLNISAGHLSEVVKNQSGKPAIKHIHERIVLEAKRLLFHTDTSLKEIAYHLGFADASYFNRFFKRETGETPSSFRDSIRKMYQ